MAAEGGIPPCRTFRQLSIDPRLFDSKSAVCSVTTDAAAYVSKLFVLKYRRKPASYKSKVDIHISFLWSIQGVRVSEDYIEGNNLVFLGT